jgi:hypothetical protein
MDKKYIYWGLGLLAVGGLAYYFMSGSTGGGAKSLGGGSSSSDTPLTDGANSSATTASQSLDQVIGGKVSAGTGRREIRRNCRQEAKDRGLRGREKRQWRRDCKRSGGYDDGLDM